MLSLMFERARTQMRQAQLERRGISDERVLAALGTLPRELFLPPRLRNKAYADQALPIECGQTISQPYIVAAMTEALELTGTERVLEIGTGSGYQTAILSFLAREVISLERHAPLAAAARVRLDQLGCRNVQIIVADGTLGWPENAPYDRVLAAATAPHVPPALVEQLEDNGILVMPTGTGDSQVLQQIRRHGGQVEVTPLMSVRFVKLIGEQGWADLPPSRESPSSEPPSSAPPAELPQSDA